MIKNLIIGGLLVALVFSLMSCEGSRDTMAYRKRQDKGTWHRWSKDECPQAYREP